MITIMYCARLELSQGRLTKRGMWAELMFCVPGLRDGVSSAGSFAVYPGRHIRYRRDRQGD